MSASPSSPVRTPGMGRAGSAMWAPGGRRAGCPRRARQTLHDVEHLPGAAVKVAPRSAWSTFMRCTPGLEDRASLVDDPLRQMSRRQVEAPLQVGRRRRVSIRVPARSPAVRPAGVKIGPGGAEDRHRGGVEGGAHVGEPVSTPTSSPAWRISAAASGRRVAPASCTTPGVAPAMRSAAAVSATARRGSPGRGPVHRARAGEGPARHPRTSASGVGW